jgi:hypothetical protein
MGKDFELEELVGAVGSGRYQVTAMLTQSDPYYLCLGKSLIRTGLLSKSGNLTFQIINDEACVTFKVLRGANDEIYPQISHAQGLFNGEIANALRLKRVIEAIAQASKGQGSR